MSHRNIVLASAIAGILGSTSSVYAADISTLANAGSDAFDMTSSTITAIPAISEAGNDSTFGGSSTNEVTAFNVITKLGKDINKLSLATDTSGTVTGLEYDEKFVRFDLSNGAEFENTPGLAIIADDVSASLLGGAGNGGMTDNVDINLSGGGSGESFVIFSIKNRIGANESDVGSPAANSTTTDDETIPSSVRLLLKMSDKEISIDDSSSDIDLTYSVYRTALDSVKGTGAALTSNTATYLKFTPGFSFSTKENTLTADVESDFLTFTTTNIEGELAEITMKVDADVYLPYQSASLPSKKGGKLNEVLEAENNTFEVSGDFTSLADSEGAYDVSRLFITTGSCSDGYNPDETGSEVSTTQSLTEDTAVIEVTPSTAASETYKLCIKRDENSEVKYKTAEYSLDFKLNTQSDIDIDDFEGLQAGKIKRDGTVLDTPFFTIIDGTISRVILSNFGANPANFTVQVQSDEGNTVTPGTVTEGTINAGTILQIRGSELASFSGKQRGSAKFTIVAPPQNISGVYQTVNLTTGAVTSIKLINEGGKH